MYIVAFHINSSYMQLCARMMLFHKDILSSCMTGDRNIIIDCSSVQEAGESGYDSGQVTFQESCGSMVQSQLQPPRSE